MEVSHYSTSTSGLSIKNNKFSHFPVIYFSATEGKLQCERKKAQTFESSAGDTGTTSTGADFLALTRQLGERTLERLFLCCGNTSEAKVGGLNDVGGLWCTDPEVGLVREE